MDLSYEEQASRDDVRRDLMATEKIVALGGEEGELSDVELRDAKLKLDLMENLIMRVTDADGKPAAAVSKVADVMEELAKVAEKRSDFESKLREVKAESGRRLLRLSTLLVMKTSVDKVLRGIIEQSVSIFDGFVNRLGSELVNSVRVGFEKAYFDNLVEFLVSLIHFSRVGATSISWRSDSEGDAESGHSSSKEATRGKNFRHRGGGKSQGRRWLS